MQQRQIVFIICLAVAAVGVGIGVIIGYFSHPGNKQTKAPNWVANVETFLRDVSENDITSFVDGIQRDNIRENLMFIAEQPHMATSPRDEELAQYIRDQWKMQLDEAYLTPYEIMHGFLKDSIEPNSVTVVDQDGAVQFEARHSEIVYEQYMKNPESIVPYFNAFGPAGDVKGKLIFANYGSEDDYAKLLEAGIDPNGTIALVKYGGGVGRGAKASIGFKYGIVGALVYSDPANYVVDGDTGYPQDYSLPGTGVQRGSALGDFGDPTTPGYSSTPYAYRRPLNDIDIFPPVPLQPIGYNDAEIFLQQLGGTDAPETFSTGLNVPNIKVGPGFKSPNDTFEVHLIAKNEYVTTTSYNVIGILRGSEEPDKYVMYGNHRDSWVYGAVDPGSGTACMMEMTRMFGELRKNGWRPRRTIMFGSWGSEEFGLLGSTEWTEDNAQMLMDRAVSYINVDIAVFANQSFYSYASPLMAQVLYDATKKVKDFNLASGTVYKNWQENYPDETNSAPLLRRLYTSSDYAPFYQMFGVTSADLSYRGNPAKDERYKISPYPTYHTGYDTFDYVDRFIDPGFFAHQVVAQVAGVAMILISDSLVIPFSVTKLSDFVQSQVDATESKFGTILNQQTISLEYLKKASQDFSNVATTLQQYIDSELDRSDPKKINAVNQRLLTVEKSFIEPNGLPDQPNLRHVSGSPGNLDDASGSFPGLQDALFGIEAGDTSRWEVVKQQLALVTHKINEATRVLMLDATPGADNSVP